MAPRKTVSRWLTSLGATWAIRFLLGRFRSLARLGYSLSARWIAGLGGSDEALRDFTAEDMECTEEFVGLPCVLCNLFSRISEA